MTGAAGFLGTHVVAALLERGHLVTSLVHRSSLPLQIEERCERVIAGDICDAAVQRQAVERVDAICHLAAHIPPTYAGLQDAAVCYAVNALATLQLATLAAEQGVGRFVHFSTGNMYAACERPCVESDLVDPTAYAADYMVSKLASELYVTAVCRRSAMTPVVLRVGTPYGPSEPESKVIPTFLRLATRHLPLPVQGGGVARFNFVHAADVGGLAATAAQHGGEGIFNVGSGESTSLLELGHAVAELYGEADVPLAIAPATGEPFAGFSAMSIEKARSVFGVAPRSLATGLAELKSAAEQGRQR